MAVFSRDREMSLPRFVSHVRPVNAFECHQKFIISAFSTLSRSSGLKAMLLFTLKVNNFGPQGRWMFRLGCCVLSLSSKSFDGRTDAKLRLKITLKLNI